MKDMCDCKDWDALKHGNSNVFQWDSTYGWVLHWIELTEDPGFTQVHRYGVSINFCPMCGSLLKNP